MDLYQLQQNILQLPLYQRQQLCQWLQETIVLEQEQLPISPGREVVFQKLEGKIVYRQELVRCGKNTCRCSTEGKLHGPYWYSYQRVNGKLKSRYVGKILKLDSTDG